MPCWAAIFPESLMYVKQQQQQKPMCPVTLVWF